MEKVFASVQSPLEISVAVARTSQSPFPLGRIRGYCFNALFLKNYYHDYKVPAIYKYPDQFAYPLRNGNSGF